MHGIRRSRTGDIEPLEPSRRIGLVERIVIGESGNMRTSEAKHTLLAVMAEEGIPLEEVDAAAAIDLFARFYADHRAVDVVGFEEEGDMLLSEWGVFDFGDGPHFRFGLTRQFVLRDEIDDDAFIHLRLILHYDASPEASALGRGSQWCHSPEELDSFLRQIRATPAAAFVADRPPIRVDLLHERV